MERVGSDEIVARVRRPEPRTLLADRRLEIEGVVPATLIAAKGRLVKVDVDDLGSGSDDGGGGDLWRGGGVARGVEEALKRTLHVGAVAQVATLRVDALGDDADPGLPDVATNGDVETESPKDEGLEVVDILEGDTRDGGKGLVAVRVVLERLRKIDGVSESSHDDGSE